MNLRTHPAIALLRELKKAAVDFLKMQRYYGPASRLRDWIKRLPGFGGNRTYQGRALHDRPVVTATEPVAPTDSGPDDADWPRITIVTSTLNQRDRLEACMASVFGQHYPNLEYIVVDRGSTDGSVEVINSHAGKIDFQGTQTVANRAEAINQGLAHATGILFNWLEPGDHLAPGALFRCADAYRKNPQAAAWVGASRRLVDAPGNGRVVYPNGIDKTNLAANWNAGQFDQASCFLDTCKVKDLGGLCTDFESYFGLDLWIRLLDRWEFAVGQGIWSVKEGASGRHAIDFDPLDTELLRVKAKHGFPFDDRRARAGKLGRRGADTIRLPQVEARLNQLVVSSSKPEKGGDKKKIAFIVYSLPRFDKSSSEYRLSTIIQLLLDRGYAIDYFYGARFHDDAAYTTFFTGAITFHYQPFDCEAYWAAIDASGADIVFISELWRVTFIEFIVRFARHVKATGRDVKIVADTVDYHSKEYQRKYLHSNDPEDLALAKHYLELETALYGTVDVVTVVSDDERRDIMDSIEGVGRIDVIPNIHDHPVLHRPFDERRHICFLGNFGTSHNADAVRYFIGSILDRILEVNPETEFHVLGFLSEKHRREFKHPNVRVVGGLKHLHKALSFYRLFACSLTYGAGMKGKIGDAIIAGTPVVTTSLGAEGFPVVDGRELFVADSPEEFAAKCNQCLGDRVTWTNFSLKARLMLAEHFSPGAVADHLEALLTT